MTFPERLRELCVRGEQVDAITLAKANLMNERDVTVTVDGSTVIVETPYFRGVHQWSVDPRDTVRIDRRGEYRCRVDGVDLTLSTATMNQRAASLAREILERRLGDRSSSDDRDSGSSYPQNIHTGTDRGRAPSDANNVDVREPGWNDSRQQWSLLGQVRRRITSIRL